MLAKNPDASRWGRFLREFRKLFLVSERHPLVFDYIRSYRALVAERRRYFVEGHSVIHPLSMFRFENPFNMLFIENCDVFLLFFQSLCFLDLVLCFNIGLLKKESASIILDRRSIARAYVCSYFLPDLLSSVPISYILLMMGARSRRDLLIPDLLPFIRGFRILSILEDLRTALQMVTKSHLWYRVIRHLLLVILAIHCFTCFLYVPSCFVHYGMVIFEGAGALKGVVPVGYTGFLDTENITRVFYDLSNGQRYIKAMFVAGSAFFSTGFNMFDSYHEPEIIVNSFIMLFGSMFKLYSVVYWLKTYMTIYNSTLRYQELLDQVEKFMSHHQFPLILMRRLRDYYRYHFQEHYYKEPVALGYLSAQLQHEIRLNTLQTMVDKVEIFQNLPPAFLGRLMGYLEHEIFLPDDLVFHVGDVSRHMYFVCTGTLALYTVKGVEAMHLVDGDYVGALTLLTASVRRVTTLVAIEITHTYRLSFEHLGELNKLSTLLLDRVKKGTFKRFTQIVHVDELMLLEPLANK
ncbi:potassium/sodium hyperpolarization-activated cyclic nucleotide-gated channel 3-like [Leguminivora glycinivorella]|uniref:potassium/sodium hyperpolarization-activated cyclic nucleotide-gated channel 3-like n=1 Tax=Leguminivora glycinivorella TaxID=1035111 RepID=UPI00200BA921|nr:potassium/sodium hyperpolarization-activated cyclic nucleotide-gated channel 3-like [Leguminivora glycinivorella]